MSLERKITPAKREVVLNGHGVPMIDIIEIAPLKTELDGSKREWSRYSTKRPRLAPARIKATPSELVNLIKETCRTNKKTGELVLSDILVPVKAR